MKARQVLFANRLNLKNVIIYLFIILYLLVGFNFDFDIFHEAIPLVCAERIASGEIPFKDFYSSIPPGQFYLLAASMTVFGWQIITARLITILIIIASLHILNKITKSVSIQSSTSFVMLVGIVLADFIPYYAGSIPTIIVIALIAISLHLKFITSKNILYLIFSGIFSGLIFYFSIYFGTYLLIANLLLIITQAFYPSFSQSRKLSNHTYELLSYALSFIIIVLPGVLYFTSQAGYDNITKQILSSSNSLQANYYTSIQRNSYQDSSAYIIQTIKLLWNHLIKYLPLFTILAALFITLVGFRKKNHIENLKLFFLLILNTLFLIHSFTFSVIEQLLPTILISLILISYIISNISNFQVKQLVYMVFFFILISIPLAHKFETLQKNIGQNNKVYIKLTRASLIKTDRIWVEDYKPCIDYLIANVPINEKIFSANTRHDKLISNDVFVYFLSEHLPATKYNELLPQVASSEVLQNEIVSSLKKNKVNYIFLTDNAYLNDFQSKTASSDIYILDEYIRDNFVIEKKFGAYSVLKRRY